MLMKTVKITGIILLMTGLMFSSAVFGVLLYIKLTGQEWRFTSHSPPPIALASTSAIPAIEKKQEAQPMIPKKTSAMLDAPLVKQNPELPSGCEITALTMLLQFDGIQKDKMELLPKMETDPTPIRWAEDGSIAYWGNPNLGYVGDITGKKKGFGIYHAALFELLKKYIPEGIDLTRSSFDRLEQQIAQGIPVVVWTTITYTVPKEEQWVVWDSPLGPVKTTFQEHSVLLVGYDEGHVYVNDPLSGGIKVKIEKEQFISSWEAMGRQALSYKQP